MSRVRVILNGLKVSNIFRLYFCLVSVHTYFRILNFNVRRQNQVERPN